MQVTNNLTEVTTVHWHGLHLPENRWWAAPGRSTSARRGPDRAVRGQGPHHPAASSASCAAGSSGRRWPACAARGEDLNIYGQLLQAKAAFHFYTRSSLEEAEVLCRKVLTLNAEYAPAWVLLSRIHGDRWRYGWTESREQAMEEALTYARRAIALDEADARPCGARRRLPLSEACRPRSDRVRARAADQSQRRRHHGREGRRAGLSRPPAQAIRGDREGHAPQPLFPRLVFLGAGRRPFRHTRDYEAAVHHLPHGRSPARAGASWRRAMPARPPRKPVPRSNRC